jgi:hypothetical protein
VQAQHVVEPSLEDAAMRLPQLSRRHATLLGIAAIFAMLGAAGTALTSKPELDRAGLARLAGDAAREPATTGSLD